METLDKMGAVRIARWLTQRLQTERCFYYVHYYTVYIMISKGATLSTLVQGPAAPKTPPLCKQMCIYPPF
jgi:hypothetical protein